MSAVKDIEFTQIAADWDSITLGEEKPQALLAIRNGLTTKQDQDKGDYKVSRIETIGGGWIDETRVRYASDVPEKDVEKYRIQKGDILFSHINSDPHLGKTGYADRDYEDLLHGMNLLLIRANPQVFEPEFLNRIFQYYRDIGVFVSICSRSVNQSSINQAKLKAVEVPLPPLPEQKKIAHILSTVQRAIEAQERIIQTTTELKKALMHKLFTEGLSRDGGKPQKQKQTEIGPVPESWKVVKIKDHCIESAFGPRFGSELYAADGNILTLRTTDMEDDGRIDYNTAPLARIDYAKFEKHYLQVGDIVVSRSGTCGIASVFEGYPLPVLPGAFLIRLRMKESVQPMFLRHYINSPVGRPYVLQLAQGAIQKNISGTRLGDLLIPFPSRAEQEEISAAVGTVDQKLANHRQKLNAHQDLFRTLLHELMTAKTRVHEIDLIANN